MYYESVEPDYACVLCVCRHLLRAFACNVFITQINNKVLHPLHADSDVLHAY